MAMLKAITINDRSKNENRPTETFEVNWPTTSEEVVEFWKVSFLDFANDTQAPVTKARAKYNALRFPHGDDKTKRLSPQQASKKMLDWVPTFEGRSKQSAAAKNVKSFNNMNEAQQCDYLVECGLAEDHAAAKIMVEARSS